MPIDAEAKQENLIANRRNAPEISAMQTKNKVKNKKISEETKSGRVKLI